jgi:N-acetylmuramoyl-L-alanine amidase
MINLMLKSGAISAGLFGYYWVFLRNRSFHRWNRGFLLATVLFAVAMPLVPLPGLSGWTGGTGNWRGVLHAVTPGKWVEGTAMAGQPVVAAAGIEWSGLLCWGYGVVVCWLAFVLLREVGFILRLYGRYPRERRGDVLFLLTREPGTPFSFLKTIFWNVEIEMESVEGRQMLRHELVHVRQWHTLDLLLMRSMMILFWCNPIFYLIYRELRTLHEFEADRCALDREDRFAYAELLVRQTLEVRQAGLFHSFFSSSIKRRITMITQFSSVRPGGLSRWMVAPMAGLLLCAFSGRVDRAPDKVITVVVDAGHGGWDDGVVAPDGVKEKDINLSLARKIKQLAAQYGVRVVLTRDKDELAGGMINKRASLHYCADLSAARKADLFLSLHTDAGNADNGFQIYLTKENAHFRRSVRLGGLLIDALRPSYTVGSELRETKQHVWVLRAATVPAVTVICGNIDNERDRAFISDAANQEKIARDILQGVVNYNK